jgi:hypothetical protein
MHGLVTLLIQLYARVGMLLTRGKQLHNPNISCVGRGLKKDEKQNTTH